MKYLKQRSTFPQQIDGVWRSDNKRFEHSLRTMPIIVEFTIIEMTDSTWKIRFDEVY